MKNNLFLLASMISLFLFSATVFGASITDFNIKKCINITAPSYMDLNSNTSVRIRVNTLNLTNFNSDGSALRIFRNGVEMERANTTAFNTATTTLWFQPVNTITAGTTDTSYCLYYNNNTILDEPPSNKSVLFNIWFDSNTDFTTIQGGCEDNQYKLPTTGKYYRNLTMYYTDDDGSCGIETHPESSIEITYGLVTFRYIWLSSDTSTINQGGFSIDDYNEGVSDVNNIIRFRWNESGSNLISVFTDGVFAPDSINQPLNTLMTDNIRFQLGVSQNYSKTFVNGSVNIRGNETIGETTGARFDRFRFIGWEGNGAKEDSRSEVLIDYFFITEDPTDVGIFYGAEQEANPVCVSNWTVTTFSITCFNTTNYRINTTWTDSNVCGDPDFSNYTYPTLGYSYSSTIDSCLNSTYYQKTEYYNDTQTCGYSFTNTTYPSLVYEDVTQYSCVNSTAKLNTFIYNDTQSCGYSIINYTEEYCGDNYVCNAGTCEQETNAFTGNFFLAVATPLVMGAGGLLFTVFLFLTRMPKSPNEWVENIIAVVIVMILIGITISMIL